MFSQQSNRLKRKVVSCVGVGSGSVQDVLPSKIRFKTAEKIEKNLANNSGSSETNGVGDNGLTSEIMREIIFNKTFIFDSNLLQSNFSGRAEIRLSDALASIKTFVQDNLFEDTRGGKVLEINRHAEHSRFSLLLPNFVSTRDLFGPDFYHFFKDSFESGDILRENVHLEIFPKVKVKFVQQVSPRTSAPLNNTERVYFRLLCCVLFNQVVGVNLSVCACYPKTENDFVLFRAGIGFNCINAECKDRLLKYPDELDNYTHTRCDQLVSVENIFVNAKILTSGDVNLRINLAKNNLENLYKKLLAM